MNFAMEKQKSRQLLSVTAYLDPWNYEPSLACLIISSNPLSVSPRKICSPVGAVLFIVTALDVFELPDVELLDEDAPLPPEDAYSNLYQPSLHS
jgi:hypothetical protein